MCAGGGGCGGEKGGGGKEVQGVEGRSGPYAQEERQQTLGFKARITPLRLCFGSPVSVLMVSGHNAF